MACLFLFTRDFRLTDNQTLEAVYQMGCRTVYPLFIFTPEQFSDENQYRSKNSLQLMITGLKGLDEMTGKRLNCCQGDTSQVVSDILATPQGDTIKYLASNLDITPFGQKRDSQLAEIAKQHGLTYLAECDYAILPLTDIKTQGGTFYKTFSHYCRQVFQKSPDITEMITPDLTNQFKFKKLTIPNSFKTSLTKMSTIIPNLYNPDNIFNPFTRSYFLENLVGEKNLQRLQDYENLRTYPRYQTSLFSAYLKYGLVSCREVYTKIYQAYHQEETELLRQLVWREFYYYLMYHLKPDETIGESNMQGKNIKWNNNQKYFTKWCQGQTGFPFIDACMRQMNKTGWMHNRARLCSANALVYLFQIDWKWGERYFAQTLADYDISQNNGNWQWCAGVGVDRKPYLRMYNPYTLSKKYDPDGSYVKKWVPELQDLDNKDLLNYDKFVSQGGLKNLDYPSPLVDYGEARKIAMSLKL